MQTLKIIKLLFTVACLLAIGVFSFYSTPARSSPATIVGGHITTDTVWTAAESPYQIDTYVWVDAGIILTIQAGVTVENYGGGGSTNYDFTVEGTLIANGSADQPIYFNGGPTGWSGISIVGQSGNIHYGSVLNNVILEGGGFYGSGAAGNLRIQYAQVVIHNSQFNHSPGDGILGDDAGAQGVANIYDSSFTGNAGYAVNFEDGSVNPMLVNLTATGNGPTLPYGGNLVVINAGTLHGSQTWENMGLPYLILQTIVGSDAILSIQPGVQVLAQPGNDGLDVQGILIANGTAAQPIHFDPADPASGWAGIGIEGTDVQLSTGNMLNYVSINKGGFFGGCDLYVTYGDVSVTHSQLDGGQNSGVCLDLGADLTMSDSQITNNQNYAMDVFDASAMFTLSNLTATGNLHNTIGIEGGTMTGIHTWAKSGINTYDLFYGAVVVAPTGTLNIQPGVTVLFGDSQDITIQGTLNAKGTRSEPIIFTGETPVPGAWAGVNIVGTPQQHAIGLLAYTTIEYGGYGGSALVNIENADVTFQNCILRYGSHDAIKILPGEGFASLPDIALASPTVMVYWSSLINNSGYAINNGSAQAVQAAYNWWGSLTGPTTDGNPGGTGSGINGPALYRPWLTGPNQTTTILPLIRRD